MCIKKVLTLFCDKFKVVPTGNLIEDNRNIESVADFIQKVNKEKELEPNKSENFYFRGEKKKYPRTIPSLYRDNELILKGSKNYYQLLMNELGYSNLLDSNSQFDFIAEMQHFGAVTRNIDISSNPLVSLFFACEDAYEHGKEDGFIYVYESDLRNEKYSTGHTAAVKTALNFIDPEVTNLFIKIMDYFDKNIGKNSGQRGVLSDSLTVDGMIDEFKRSFKCYDVSFNNPKDAKDSASLFKINDTIDSKIVDKYGKERDISEILKEFKANHRDISNLYNESGELKQGENKETHATKLLEEALAVEVKSEIAKFLRYTNLDNDDHYISYLNKEGLKNLSLEYYQDYLLQKIRQRIQRFMESLNQNAKIKERLVFPNQIYRDITGAQIFRSPKNQKRISNQNGLFILPAFCDTSDGDIQRIQNVIDCSIKQFQVKDCGGKSIVYRIPKERKKTIINELMLLGIDEGFIYPDIEHQSKAVLRRLKREK